MNDCTLNYSLLTNIAGDDIYQELQLSYHDQVETVSRWVVTTRDEELRKALIKLGWTPPQGIS